MFALISSVVGFSQLSEVKGVETKLDVYDGKIYDYNKTEWFGYSFYNMNGFRVSVEAELYKFYKQQDQSGNGDYVQVFDAILIDTKTFNLAPEETYIWKQEHNSDFQKTDKGMDYPQGYYDSDGHYDSYADDRGEAISYYVKYKAYKME